MPYGGLALFVLIAVAAGATIFGITAAYAMFLGLTGASALVVAFIMALTL